MATVLDGRKSLLIAFLAISDQYETFFFENGTYFRIKRPYMTYYMCFIQT